MRSHAPCFPLRRPRPSGSESLRRVVSILAPMRPSAPLDRVLGLRTVQLAVLLTALLLAAPPLLATPAQDLEEADRAEAAGEIERTLTLLRRVATDPSSGAGAEALARLCRLSPDADEAIEAAMLLLDHHRHHPDAGSASEILGFYRAARGEYRTAARLFKTAASRATGTEEGRLLMLSGRALLGAGRANEAREVFNDVTRLPVIPEDQAAAALLGIGDAELLKERFSQAAASYGDYLERFPQSDELPIVLGQLVRALDGLKQTAETLVVLERLVAEFPESTEAAAARDRLRGLSHGDESSTTAQATTSSERPRGHYSLQVGAFGSEENAQELARQLQEFGLPEVRIERERRDDGKLFYRVRLGAYRDPEEAEAAGQQLRESHGMAGQVVLR